MSNQMRDERGGIAWQPRPGYKRFHVYDRDNQYMGNIHASHAHNALMGARDVYSMTPDRSTVLHVWYVVKA